MSCWIGIPQGVILHITVSIKCLGVRWPPRAAHLVPRPVAELEPEARLVLAIQLAEELVLVEADGQRLDLDGIHATRGVPRDNRIC